MPDRIDITATIDAIEGTANKVINRTLAVTDLTITQKADMSQVIAAGASAAAVNLEGIANCKYLALAFDGAVTVQLQSNTAPAITCDAGAFLIFAAAHITTVYVSNAGSVPVNAKVLPAA